MCGIAGYINFSKGDFAHKETLKKMTDSIIHRGPDGEGFFIKDNIALGHRRLSIIDLKTGNQPMYNDDKSIVIIFNGEIYNYIELKRELIEFGYNFKTNSDTEVIIHAYEKWGIECQNKFNGMWAFALWDQQKEMLFLSRDRLGEKPLFYGLTKDSFVFGSEIKSLMKYGIEPEKNLDVLEIYLSLGYVPAPYTFYKSIIKLLPGSYLIFQNNNIKIGKYWMLPDINEEQMKSNRKEIYETFEYLLKDSVQLRMRSDVPYGAFLSGGLDSSSIVAIMSEISNFPVETFTISYKDKEYDESVLASMVAKEFNSNHHTQLITPEKFEESLEKVLFHYDEPFGDSSSIPTGYVSKYARQKVKMALTGDGGDEVLSGYTAYQGEKFANQLKQVPTFLIDTIHDLTVKIKHNNNSKFQNKTNKFIKILNSSTMSFNSRLIAKSSWCDISTLRNLVIDRNIIHIEDYINQEMNQCKYKDDFYKRMYFDFSVSLPDDMLVKLDRMSMAYSLETRVPFLDYRLVEFMIGVDKSIKMNGYERKSILRNTIGRKIPNSLLKAKKKGFTVPLKKWFGDKNFKPYLDLLMHTDLGLNNKAVKEIINDNTNNIQDNGNLIWMLFLYKKWIEN